jgi:hypothetical protein
MPERDIEDRLFYVISCRTGIYPSAYLASGLDIIQRAYRRIRIDGGALEEIIGIPGIVGDDGKFVGFARQMTPEEEFGASIGKLGEGGRVCLVFDADGSSSAFDFIAAASEYGLDDAALDAVIHLGREGTISELARRYFIFWCDDEEDGATAFVVNGLPDIAKARGEGYWLHGISSGCDEAARICDSLLSALLKEKGGSFALCDAPRNMIASFPGWQYGMQVAPAQASVDIALCYNARQPGQQGACHERSDFNHQA